MVNKLVLGSAQFGLNYGISNKNGRISKSAIIRILKFASENQIHFLDTAPSYGNSEKILGDICNRLDNQFQFISKFSLVATTGELEHQLINTLARLRSQSLYGYIAHECNCIKTNPKLLTDLQYFKSKNLVRKIGISSYHIEEIEWILEKHIPIDLIQFPYNVFDRRIEPYLGELQTRKIEIHARSMFLQGLFFMNPNHLTEHFIPVKPKILALHRLAREYMKPLNELLIQFALNNKQIDKFVVGIESLDNLKENVFSFKNLKDFTPDLVNEMDNLKENNLSILLPYLWK